MIQALSEYQFLQNAFAASLLASIVCVIIGVIIVEKKLVMMSGGIAHTAYGGVGLGYFFGFEPIIGAFLFAIAAALGIGTIKRKGGVQADILIGLFWSLGMAFGIVFIALMPGYPPDLNSYLFGNILSVTQADLTLMLLVTLLVLAVVFALFNAWKAYLFDEEFASIIGVRTVFLEYLLLVLVAMTVVVLIRVAGIILVLALLTAPAAMAALFSKQLKNRMLLAVLFGAFFSISGLWVSYGLNIPSGACIVMIAVACYFLTYALRATGSKMRRKSLAAKQSAE